MLRLQLWKNPSLSAAVEYTESKNLAQMALQELVPSSRDGQLRPIAGVLVGEDSHIHCRRELDGLRAKHILLIRRDALLLYMRTRRSSKKQICVLEKDR